MYVLWNLIFCFRKEERLSPELKQVQESDNTTTTVPADEARVTVDRTGTLPQTADMEQSVDEEVPLPVQRSGGSEHLSELTACDKQVECCNVDNRINDQTQQQSTLTVGDNNQHMEIVTDSSSETKLSRCGSEHMDVEDIEYVSNGHVT